MTHDNKTRAALDTTDKARANILKIVGFCYKEYVEKKLAGDFACDISKALTEAAELKAQNEELLIALAEKGTSHD